MAENKSRVADPGEPVSFAPGSPADWPECWPVTPAQYEQLVDCMIQPLVRYAFRRLLSAHDAEDVVQNVLLKAFALRARHAGKPGVVAYLYRMTANACNDIHRREKMHREKLGQNNSFQVIEGIGQTEHEALAELERIEKLLAELPRRQAEVIRLRIIDELSFNQIARILKARVQLVSATLSIGRWQAALVLWFPHRP